MHQNILLTIPRKRKLVKVMCVATHLVIALKLADAGEIPSIGS
jgi:hypothetical protein